MDGVMEIITGRERRRRWSTEFKLRVVSETQEPGAQVRVVSARHGVCESLVFTWRRQVRDGILTAPEMPMFMPAQMTEAPMSTAGLVRMEKPLVPAPVPQSARPQAGMIEVELGGGRQVRVGSDVNLAALRRVLSKRKLMPTVDGGVVKR